MPGPDFAAKQLAVGKIQIPVLDGLYLRVSGSSTIVRSKVGKAPRVGSSAEREWKDEDQERKKPAALHRRPPC